MVIIPPKIMIVKANTPKNFPKFLLRPLFLCYHCGKEVIFMDNNDFEKDMDEWEDFFSPDDFEEEDDLAVRFDREMKKTLAQAATEIEIKELEKKTDHSADTYWKNEYEKLLLQSREKDIQIVDLTKEKIELYNKTKDLDMNGALLFFISCVLGLVLPFAAIGITQVKDMLVTVNNPLPFAGFLLLMMLLAGGIILWLFVPICALLVSAFNLEKCHREGKKLKTFLVAAVAVILLAAAVIFIL